MTEKPQRGGFASNRIVSTLRELISALDRRVPHDDRPGELRIAQDAQMLRRQAVEALNRQESADRPYDQELVNAIMTDDGCPSPGSEANRRSSGVWRLTAAFRSATTAG